LPLQLPSKRITYSEALELAGEKAGVKMQWGDDLDTETERFLGETIGEHYFLTDWPSSIEPYYTLPYEDRPEVCRGFDLMHPRMELASGAQRVHDYNQLVVRIKRKGWTRTDLSSTSRPSATACRRTPAGDWASPGWS
jgi:nondiscriminating aspartyl-tRNA synthetase